jgi:pimeloyl-[acyl-carrier protein] synthase
MVTSVQRSVTGSNGAVSSGSLEPLNPFTPVFRADPYTIYHTYRSREPVHWGMPTTPWWSGSWYLTRYADIVTVLKEPRFGKEVHHLLPPEELPAVPQEYTFLYQLMSDWMLFRDPPDHTRLRGLVQKAFTPRMVDRIRPRTVDIARSLLDRVQRHGQMDLITDFAFPLPVTVIAELLGVPVENHTQFRQWAQSLIAVIDLKQSEEEESYRRGRQAALEVSAYLQRLIAEKRQRPQGDLLSTLIAVEAEGERLSEAELLATCLLLLLAGHETTVNLIGNGMLALLQHPEQLAMLRTNPAYLPTAIEELLRYDSPAQMTTRYAMVDTALGGKTMRKGEQVCLVLGAANRDPEQFLNPDRLDITRSPNRHLSFGLGVHFCLGAFLARLEAQVAFEILLHQLANVELRTETPAWRETIALRGLKTLPVSFSVQRCA